MSSKKLITNVQNAPPDDGLSVVPQLKPPIQQRGRAHIAGSDNSITKKQQSWEMMMFILLGVGITMSSWTTYQQRNTKDKGAARSYIQATAAGYIIGASALFLIIPLLIKAKKMRLEDIGQWPGTGFGQKMSSALSLVILFPLPYTLTIGILATAAGILLSYQDQIAKRRVAAEYYTWSATFSFLLVIQSFLLFNFSSTLGSEPSPLRYVIYLLSVFNAIALGIMQTILKFFSTDG